MKKEDTFFINRGKQTKYSKEGKYVVNFYTSNMIKLAKKESEEIEKVRFLRKI